MRLLVATQNPGKIEEFRQLLAPLEPTGVQLCFPDELGLQVKVLEDGGTYQANAAKKAIVYGRTAHLLTLADDSGLEVDALLGAPGIRSARYTPGGDGDRVAALLAQMEGVPWEQRTARFRCIIAICKPGAPDDHLHYTEGVCEGYIALEPSGDGGFGYDPIFYLPDYGCTMAHLPAEEKNRISHRGWAAAAALPILADLTK
jgi:XTP/dITP diphosphohydrolase